MSTTRIKSTAIVAVAVVCALYAGRAFSEEKSEAQLAPKTDRLTEEVFQTIFDALQPPKVELWKSIPWHISIVEATMQAEKEGKPVFMWQADGWPLGCG